MKKHNKKLFIISIIVIITTVTISSAYAVTIVIRSKKEIQTDRINLVKKFNNEIGSQPQNKSLTERLSEGQKFKDSFQQLANEEAQQGLEIDEDKILTNDIEASVDALESLIRSYENDKSYLDLAKPDNKKDYELAKKKLDFLKALKEDYTNSKITAKDGLKKFDKVRELR